MAAMVETAVSGKSPFAVSPESITQSVPSYTALATSVISALVGRGLLIIDSSIWGSEGKDRVTSTADSTSSMTRSYLCCADDRLSGDVAFCDHHLLRHGDLLRGDLHAEVPASHHDAVSHRQDLVEVVKALEAQGVDKEEEGSELNYKLQQSVSIVTLNTV